MFIKVKVPGNEYNKILLKDCYNVQKFPFDYFDTIIDIGANIGIFSVFMKMRNPKAKIIALEPLEAATAFIKGNVHAHGIFLEEKALGTGDSFYLHERGHILDGIYSPEEKGKKIESITLGDLFKLYNCKLSDKYLIKINCEGGEKYLIGDKIAENILYNAKLVTMQAHFKTEWTNFESWLEQKDYDGWVNNTFTHHTIAANNRWNKRGTTHYTITRID